MLVGRGMKNHRWPVMRKQRLQQSLVLYLAENGHIILEAVFVEQLHLDLVQILLAGIHENEGGGLEADNLATEFRTDGTAGPGNQNRLSRQNPADLFKLKAYRWPAQKIFVRNIPDGFDGNLVADQLSQTRQSFERNFARPAQFDNSLHLVTAGRRNGDEYLLSLDFYHILRQSRNGTKNRNAVNPLTDLGGMIIKKSDHNIRQRLVIVNFPDQLFGCVTGADDEQSLSTPPFAVLFPKKRQEESTLIKKPETEAKSGDKEKGQHNIENKNRS